MRKYNVSLRHVNKIKNVRQRKNKIKHCDCLYITYTVQKTLKKFFSQFSVLYVCNVCTRWRGQTLPAFYVEHVGHRESEKPYEKINSIGNFGGIYIPIQQNGTTKSYKKIFRQCRKIYGTDLKIRTNRYNIIILLLNRTT